MEDPIKQQPSLPGVSGLKQRFPLRSSARLKEAKSVIADSSNSTASKRGRPVSTVSQSVSVLNLSGKEKSAKPPRRLSIPTKANATVSRPGATITPISEARMKRSINGKSDTPQSTSQKRFSALSRASYWLSQIKISESAAKHSISLGFFKLAFEAGCEPLQRMKDELKCYVRSHNLVDHGELVKEVFERYNISQNLDKPQVYQSFSQRPEEDDARSSSSTVGTRKLKPKSLNTDASQASSVTELDKEKTAHKNKSSTKTGGSLNKNAANSKSVSDAGCGKAQKKHQKPNKQDINKEKQKAKKGMNVDNEEGTILHLSSEDTVEENKENMDAPPMEEIGATE